MTANQRQRNSGAEKGPEDSELATACHPAKELSFLKEKYFLLTGALYWVTPEPFPKLLYTNVPQIFLLEKLPNIC
jgi:hypothetical protein